MLVFVIRRLGTMVLTMLCLTIVVFFLINLDPNLKKLAISQTEMHTSAEQLEDWLVNHGYRQNFFVRYGQWLGVVPKQAVVEHFDRQGYPALCVLQRSDRTDVFGDICRAISAARPSSRPTSRRSCFRRSALPAF